MCPARRRSLKLLCPQLRPGPAARCAWVSRSSSPPWAVTSGSRAPPRRSDRFSIVQIIQGDLESIGVTMTITQMNQRSMLARMHAHQFQADFHDPQYTSLVTAASTEVDSSKRMQLYSQINDFLLDACFDLPIDSSSTRALATRQLHGVGHRRNDFFTFTDAWLG